MIWAVGKEEGGLWSHKTGSLYRQGRNYEILPRRHSDMPLNEGGLSRQVVSVYRVGPTGPIHRSLWAMRGSSQD